VVGGIRVGQRGGWSLRQASTWQPRSVSHILTFMLQPTHPPVQLHFVSQKPAGSGSAASTAACSSALSCWPALSRAAEGWGQMEGFGLV
jgi:hypothetical protein